MQKRLVTLVIAALAIPALAAAQKVSYDYEKSANFPSFKTYAHKDGTKVGQPLIDDRIIAAIEAQLAEKGFTKAEANPDVFVVYHVAFDKQKDISTYSSGYGGGYGPYGWGWGGGGWAGTTSTTPGARHPGRHDGYRSGRRKEGRSLCGVGWASRKSIRRRTPKSATRASTTPSRRSSRTIRRSRRRNAERQNRSVWRMSTCFNVWQSRSSC